MDVTPKAKSKGSLSLKKSGSETPYHSTPEASTSEESRVVNSSEQFSPIDSPSRYDLCQQDIHVCWGWKSPDGISLKKTGRIRARTALKIDITSQNANRSSSPKPKRKLNHRSYSDKLRSLAEELKSFTKGMQSSVLTGKSTEDSAGGSAVSFCELIRDEPSLSKPSSCDAFELNNNDPLGGEQTATAAEEKDDGRDAHQDFLVVELTQGDLTSLKAFPPNHHFPKVPKLELETDMNNSDYLILMEDNSIEDEMMSYSQNVEEECVGRNGEKGKGPQQKDLNTKNARNKLAGFITLPKHESNSNSFPVSPVINTKCLSIKRNSHSPKNRLDSKRLVMVNQAVSRDSGIGVVSRGERCCNADEDVMCMLADDSFDNIMLDLVVQSEPNNPHKDEENVSACPSAVRRIGDHSLKLEGDSLGMLEDDSLIQPEVLNFLDRVESQAIAASQSSKCTQEEIKLKMMEAKKKLAVGKRKRRSRINGVSTKASVTSNEETSR